jgi:D-sedoheptulose 7-phosphate isomerase
MSNGQNQMTAKRAEHSSCKSDIGRNHLIASREVIDLALEDDDFVTSINAIANLITARLRSGNKVMFAGNGGSAADAQHIAGEFVSKLNYDRAAIAGLALTTDSSVLTAIGNDYGYEQIFSRQIKGIGRTGDIFVGISTFGRSPNILAALSAAREMGIHTIGFTGNGEREMLRLCELVLAAPSSDTPVIQQLHITAAHAICEIIETTLFPRAVSA